MADYVVTFKRLVPDPHMRFRYMGVDPKTCVAAAESKVDAFCVAFDHLTRAGNRVKFPHEHGWRALLTEAEWKAAVAKGVPASAGSAGGTDDVVIDSIEPYKLNYEGRILYGTFTVVGVYRSTREIGVGHVHGQTLYEASMEAFKEAGDDFDIIAVFDGQVNDKLCLEEPLDKSAFIDFMEA